MTARIKNWKKYQHFKDRTPPWIKLYRDLLEDPDWHDLDSDKAKILIGLWLIASEDEGKSGALPDFRKIAFRLRSTPDQVREAISSLSHWVIRDDIDTISGWHRVGPPETETETETEEKKERQQEGKSRWYVCT